MKKTDKRDGAAQEEYVPIIEGRALCIQKLPMQQNFFQEMPDQRCLEVFEPQLPKGLDNSSDAEVVVPACVQVVILRSELRCPRNRSCLFVVELHAIEIKHQLVRFDDACKSQRVIPDGLCFVDRQRLSRNIHPMLTDWKQPLNICMVLFEKFVVSEPLSVNLVNVIPVGSAPDTTLIKVEV